MNGLALRFVPDEEGTSTGRLLRRLAVEEQLPPCRLFSVGERVRLASDQGACGDDGKKRGKEFHPPRIAHAAFS